MTLGFWNVGAAAPDRVAVIDADGTRTTFGELLRHARQVGASFEAMGIGPGDHVAVALPNHRSFFEVLFAALERGLVITPVNAHLAAPEIAHVLSDSGALVFVSHESIAAVATGAADAAGVPAERRFAVGSVPGFRPYDELLRGSEDPPLDRRAGTTMMYTSGTTGKPKGVKRAAPVGDPDELFGGLAEVTCRGFGVPVGPHVHLTCGPLYHAGPLVGAQNALHVGATVALMDRWSPESFLELVEALRVESTQMVPTMFHRLLQLPAEVRARYDVSSIRSVFHTGAPCPVEVKAAMMDWWGPVVYETYGGTESVGTIATPKRWLERPGTVGKAVRGARVHILDDDGNELPAGEVGHIYLETAAPPPEYHNDHEKSAAIRRGRMVTLGDIGLLDDDGYLFLRDRKVDLIISGGVNVYPAEVEAVLLADPEIADATVIGVPDDDWGEAVKAIVELRPGVEPDAMTAAAIIERCQQHIARFKAPRSIDFVAALPRMPNGKVEKRRLRDPYWAGRGRAI